MAKTLIEVDTSLLSSDISKLRDEREGLKNALNGVYTEISELDAMWDGTANEAFNSQFRSDREMFDELLESLGQFIESMENARKEYDNCENGVRDIVNAIKIG